MPAPRTAPHLTRRRLGALALAAAGAVAAACGAGGGDTGGQQTQATPGSVEWMVWDAGPAWGRVADRFNLESATVKATVTQHVLSAQAFAEKLQAVTVAGTAPDVAMSSPIWVRPLVEAKVYQPIDDLARRERGWTDSYYPAALDTFRVKGKLYGVWHYANPQGTFFNKELLAQSGAKEPAANWTYQDWLTLARQITKRGEPATSIWGTDAPTSFNYVFNAIWSFGGSLFDSDDDPKRFTGTAGKTVEGLQFLSDLLYTHRVAATAADRAGQGNLWTTGRQGFVTAIVVAIGGYRRDLKFQWDVVGVPRGPGTRANFFGANGTAFTVPGNRNPAAAWTFLKYLGGTPGQKIYLAEFGAVPTLKALAENDFVRQAPPPANVKAISDAMAYIRPLPKLPSLELQQVIDAAFQAIFTGQKAPKAAMEEIERPVNQLLRQ